MLSLLSQVLDDLHVLLLSWQLFVILLIRWSYVCGFCYARLEDIELKC
jgi:hypothetical protein